MVAPSAYVVTEVFNVATAVRVTMALSFKVSLYMLQ